MGTGLVGVIDEIELEAAFAVSTLVALYARRRLTIFHNAIIGITVNANNFYNSHREMGRISAKLAHQTYGINAFDS